MAFLHLTSHIGHIFRCGGQFDKQLCHISSRFCTPKLFILTKLLENERRTFLDTVFMYSCFIDDACIMAVLC